MTSERLGHWVRRSAEIRRRVIARFSGELVESAPTLIDFLLGRGQFD